MKVGCKDNDRRIGPWQCIHDNAWKVPVWRRLGPSGYRNMFNDEVAYVSLTGYVAFAPNGLTEESGHLYGDITENEITSLRDMIDETLRGFGWVVDGTSSARPTVWQRVMRFLGG